MTVLDLVYALVAVATAPLWARKARSGWSARFGKGPALPPADRPRVLVHAVSVGEVNALRQLAGLLAGRTDLVVSASTDTGLARAHELYDDIATVVRYPLDASWAVRRFLDRVRPDAVALVELELWPTFLKACARRGIPVCVVNGRLSARSFRGYRRLSRWMRASFETLSFAAVQDEAYARRFVAMGVPEDRCLITGTMKWDAVPIQDSPDGADELARDLGIDRDRPLIVAGSTGPGEEALLARATPPGAQLLCAPRKPERFDEAARALGEPVRRSAGRAEAGGADRFVLDTIGELRAAYSLADVVVIGRSFGELHGSDPMEPAALGRAIVAGPRMEDFASAVEALEQAGGIVRTTRDGLGGDLAGLIDDPARRSVLGAAARRCVVDHQGASARHAQLIEALIRPATPHQPSAARARIV